MSREELKKLALEQYHLERETEFSEFPQDVYVQSTQEVWRASADQYLIRHKSDDAIVQAYDREDLTD